MVKEMFNPLHDKKYSKSSIVSCNTVQFRKHKLTV